jgi:hypothetical protein
VHAWAIRAKGDGCADLTLDLDFLTEWANAGDGSFRFRVAPATLVFFDVFGLVMQVDYTGFAVEPFSIHAIEREPTVEVPGLREFEYRITIEPRGRMTFFGHRFVQRLRAAPILTRSQDLDPAQRVPFTAGS